MNSTVPFCCEESTKTLQGLSLHNRLLCGGGEAGLLKTLRQCSQGRKPGGEEIKTPESKAVF